MPDHDIRHALERLLAHDGDADDAASVTRALQNPGPERDALVRACVSDARLRALYRDPTALVDQVRHRLTGRESEQDFVQRGRLALANHKRSQAIKRRWLIRGLAAAAVLMISVLAWQLVPSSTHTTTLAKADLIARDGLHVIADTTWQTVRWPHEDTTCRVAPGSELVFADTDAKRVRLIGGSLEWSVAQQPAQRRLEITTGHATARVIGTTFTIATSGSGTAALTTLKVSSGEVRFSDRHGSVLVPAGKRASSDDRGLWLNPSAKAVSFSMTEPDHAVPYQLTDTITTTGPSLMADDLAQYPAAHKQLLLSADGVISDRLIAGTAWPIPLNVVKHGLGEGEAVFGPHPADGTNCLRLRTVSGGPFVQVLIDSKPLALGTAHRLSWRYRTTANAEMGFWIMMNDIRSRPERAPVAQSGWRTVVIDLPATTVPGATLGLRVQNHGAALDDWLAIADIALHAVAAAPATTGTTP
ncbi:MAG: FecR domain-containing protein [Planctomycetes bacterium]|nr:FecR domain-containing protein [Planctomycetota bacterium]